uniref:C2H2-type domain-containing protein n=1 Tax=Culex tarsalis TaxID=7177 RepID=A0A1Q3EXC1_CULTA
MDPRALNFSPIVKQELIVDDLELHDYEHLLQEFYYDEPDPDENQNNTDSKGCVQDEVSDLKEAASFADVPLVLDDVEPDPDGTWHCPVCPNSFKWRMLFVIHVKSHFRCDACNLAYTTKIAYDQHNQLEHGFIFPPASLPQKVPSEGDHSNVPSDPVRSAPLESEVSHPSGGQEHQSCVIMKEEFVFKGQDEADDDEKSLVDVQVKQPESLQRCPVCKELYITVAELQRHVRRHHGNDKQRREALPKIVLRKNTQTNNETRVVPKETKPDVHCARCNKTFASHLKFKAHQKRHTNFDSGRFKCSYCSKPLATKQELIVHISHFHQENPSKRNQKRDQAERRKIVPKAVLPRQKIKQNPATQRNEGKGRLKGSRRCTVCEQWFLTEDELRDHFATHNVNKSFAYCAQCDKKFYTIARFKIHKMRHRNVELRRFCCSLCTRAFPSKKEQDAHEQNHKKHKAGRASKVGSLSGTTSELSPHQRTNKSEAPTRRKIGPSKNLQQKAGIVQDESACKVRHPNFDRRCPLCKVRVRSAAKFKDHIGRHIHG